MQHLLRKWMMKCQMVANEQEDEAAKETEEGEASDECTDNE